MALDGNTFKMEAPERAARFLAFMEYPVERIVAFLEGREDFDGDASEVAHEFMQAFTEYKLSNITTSLVELDEEERAEDARRAVAAEHDLARSNRA